MRLKLGPIITVARALSLRLVPIIAIARAVRGSASFGQSPAKASEGDLKRKQRCPRDSSHCLGWGCAMMPCGPEKQAF